MPVDDHYNSLQSRSRDAFAALLAAQPSLQAFTKAHNFTADYELLHEAIQVRPEAQVMAFAIREYQYALYAVCNGTYRHAFISLRLFFELSLAAVHFSAYEIKLRKWLQSSGDIVWNALVEPENGVFSKSFIRAFGSGLDDYGKQHSVMAETVYRECSEYVHGNPRTHQGTALPLGFDANLVADWVEKADTVRVAILFAYASRYLSALPPADKAKIESVIIESLGHLQAIQIAYSGAA